MSFRRIAHLTRLLRILPLVIISTSSPAEELVPLDTGTCKIMVPVGVMADLTTGGHQVWIGECKDGLATEQGKFYRIRSNLVEGLAIQTRERGERKISDYYTYKQGTKEVLRITAGLKSPADGRYPVPSKSVPDWVSEALGKPLAGYPSTHLNPKLEDSTPVLIPTARDGIRELALKDMFKGNSETEIYKQVMAENMLHRYVGFMEKFPATDKRAAVEAKIATYRKVLVGSRAEIILTDQELRTRYNWNGDKKSASWTASAGAYLNIPPEPVWEGRLTYGNLLIGGTFRTKDDGLHLYRNSALIYPSVSPTPSR